MFKPVHISLIEMTDAENLSAMILLSDSSCKLQENVNFTVINIDGLAEVNIEEDYQNNQKTYKTTLQFNSCSKKPLSMRQKAFRLTALDGRRYLIGTSERPFPIIKEKNPFPRQPTGEQMKSVSISWNSIHPMMMIEE